MKNFILKAVLLFAEWVEEHIGLSEKVKLVALLLLICLVPATIHIKDDSELLGLAFIAFIICIICLLAPRTIFDAIEYEYYEEEEEDVSRSVSRESTRTNRYSQWSANQEGE